MELQAKNQLIKTLFEFDVSTLTEEGRSLRYTQLKPVGTLTYGELWADLYQIGDSFEALEKSDQEQVLPHLFAFLERCGDIDIGSPGPMVHCIESTKDLYYAELEKSVNRKPTPLTVWMLNRIINESVDHEKVKFLQLLIGALDHPFATDLTIEAATDFFDYQSSINTIIFEPD